MGICTTGSQRSADRHHLRALQSCLDAMQVAEVMAKVAEQVREAEDEAERRSPILTALQDLTSMRTECAWLASYEKDDARFKVCFQHKSLSFSISAKDTSRQLVDTQCYSLVH